MIHIKFSSIFWIVSKQSLAEITLYGYREEQVDVLLVHLEDMEIIKPTLGISDTPDSLDLQVTEQWEEDTLEVVLL